MDRITESSLDINKLEKKIESTLMMHPQAVVELTDLSETAFESLKKYFESKNHGEKYYICGLINVLNIEDERTNYTLHIRRRS